MKKNRIIRLSGIALILASAAVMADAFDLVRPDVAIGTMFFAMLFGSSGLAVFLWRAAGRWAAGLGLLGVLLILGSNLLYPSDAFAWMFALGLLSVGIALFPAGVLARRSQPLPKEARSAPSSSPTHRGVDRLVSSLSCACLWSRGGETSIGATLAPSPIVSADARNEVNRGSAATGGGRGLAMGRGAYARLPPY